MLWSTHSAFLVIQHLEIIPFEERHHSELLPALDAHCENVNFTKSLKNLMLTFWNWKPTRLDGDTHTDHNLDSENLPNKAVEWN
jgi:hypothetical protein